MDVAGQLATLAGVVLAALWLGALHVPFQRRLLNPWGLGTGTVPAPWPNIAFWGLMGMATIVWTVGLVVMPVRHRADAWLGVLACCAVAAAGYWLGATGRRRHWFGVYLPGAGG